MADNNPVQPVLDIRGLSVTLPKGADRKFAIEDISLSVGRGEIVCVVGESGSGKTTISLASLSYTKPGLEFSGGEVLLNGEDVLTMEPIRQREIRGQNVA